MAVYRQVQITFWQDPFVLELLPEEKYFYLYLLTNSKTTQSGIYEISEMIIKLETGLEKEKVKELLSKFVEYKKIKYDQGTKEIFILNWLKFNPIRNINVEKCVLKELKFVKSENFIKGFLAQCLELKFEIPRLQGAYKGLAMGGCRPN
ncbi:replication protein [Clostridium estertheticum]|uniref:replication protein n=1 Tax=Clostridium estertheticum TaxID=238834 RepID=UPI001CF477CA|nr:replication protein [Clostridium estertheticum]MCB2359437.1 replication protein [Clostridium estertheticum]